MAEWQPLMEFVKNFGFPVAVAGFVLLRLDKTLRDLVLEMRADRETRLAAIEALEKLVSSTGDRVIRDVDHNLRAAVAHVAITRRDPR